MSWYSKRSGFIHKENTTNYCTIWEKRVKGSNRLSPAAAMSLNRGCEERPSRRKGG